MSHLRTWRAEDPDAPVWRVAASAAVIVVMAIAAFGLTIVRAPEDIAASRDRGVRGTFTVTSSACAKGCTTDGDFRSADRAVVARHVGYESSRPIPVGTSVPGQYFAGPHRAVYRLDPSPWQHYSVISAAMVVYLPFLAWCWTTRRGRAFLSWNFNMGRWRQRRRDEARAAPPVR